MEMNKARNLIEHEEEIFSRPPRVWFQSKADLKRKSGKRPFEFEVLDSFICTISFDAEVKFQFSYVFLSTDKAANGPGSKISKKENKKGKTAASANENVRLPCFFRCLPFYSTIRTCDNCLQRKMSYGFSKNSISTNWCI